MGATVREIIDRYLTSSAKNGTHGAEAFAERQRVLNRFASATIGGREFGIVPVSECLPHYLSDWIENNPRWKAPSTRRGIANAVKACFNWALRGRRIADNPFASVNYEDSEPRSPLSDATLAKITDRCSKPFEELATYLRLTSRRLSEVCGLRWEHIDWQDATARVAKHKSRKKTKKDQFYVLVPEAIDLLTHIKDRQGSPTSGVVFLNNSGTPWNKGTAGQYLRRLKARLGIQDKATLHGIRHQAITEMIRHGASIKAASLQAGHSDTRITERVYCHLEGAFEEMRNAVKLGVSELGSKKT